MDRWILKNIFETRIAIWRSAMLLKCLCVEKKLLTLLHRATYIINNDHPTTMEPLSISSLGQIKVMFKDVLILDVVL